MIHMNIAKNFMNTTKIKINLLVVMSVCVHEI